MSGNARAIPNLNADLTVRLFLLEILAVTSKMNGMPS